LLKAVVQRKPTLAQQHHQQQQQQLQQQQQQNLPREHQFVDNSSSNLTAGKTIKSFSLSFLPISPRSLPSLLLYRFLSFFIPIFLYLLRLSIFDCCKRSVKKTFISTLLPTH
jgi:predicted PurR-regulated permease PerM